VRNAALYSRGALSVAMVVLGIIILARVLPLAHTGGFAILPGIILGAAMVALGVHRISLIVRLRRAQ
jgi:hypothetical protein